ncbi:chorismate synthase-like [Ylistrum balloti]|uniref:chorismate synthase-like n=1 Tax=Ylistrum balloti TaxID=509963 RepID=UPI002905BA3F|nr:chorismate synthase-like [Ylistrum balloti]
MSSTFGTLLKLSTFGESHGEGVGVILEGVSPGLELHEEDIQKELDRRKPGQSDIATPRKESDTVHILSGVFEGKTTGTPLMMLLYNSDIQSKDYNSIKDYFRPGHADFTYLQKYGFRDWRGSGRASGRETAARVAAGAVAKKILSKKGVRIIAYTYEAGGIACKSIDTTVIEKNPMRAADMDAAAQMLERGLALKKEQNSMGGIITCIIQGVRAGIGEPVFDKLDALLSHAIMSIGAVKGIEFGSGFAASKMTGREHNDAMTAKGFDSNNAGGILGGISTGENIIIRIAVKPVSSIASPQNTLSITGVESVISTEGRHDICICPRIIPVVEAMSALVLGDLYKRHEALFI